MKKTSISSHNRMADQFSTSSVKQLLRLLVTLRFFSILTRSTNLLGIFIEVRCDNVNFCVHISECLLPENVYLLLFTSVYVFYSSMPKIGTFLMRHPVFMKT